MLSAWRQGAGAARYPFGEEGGLAPLGVEALDIVAAAPVGQPATVGAFNRVVHLGVEYQGSAGMGIPGCCGRRCRFRTWPGRPCRRLGAWAGLGASHWGVPGLRVVDLAVSPAVLAGLAVSSEGAGNAVYPAPVEGYHGSPGAGSSCARFLAWIR